MADRVKEGRRVRLRWNGSATAEGTVLEVQGKDARVRVKRPGQDPVDVTRALAFLTPVEEEPDGPVPAQ